MQRNGAPSEHRNHFAKIKPLCVALLPRAPLTPQQSPVVRKQLRDLRAALQMVPLAGQLLDYAFFPLSQLLRVNSMDVFAKHPSALEECMRTMTIIVKPWRRATPAMNADLVGQIWLVCILVLGGPLELPNGKGKARGVEWSEETKVAALDLLEALLEPILREAPIEAHGPVQPTSLFTPTNGVAHSPSLAKATPLPILAHTLTALLDLIQDAGPPALRSQALVCLRFLISDHLPRAAEGQVDLLVQTFPGIVSALAALLGGRTSGAVTKVEVKAGVAAKALDLLGAVIEQVAGDEACRDILAKRRRTTMHIDRLEDLVVEAQVDGPPQSKEASTGLRSQAWLDSTVSQLHVALLSFITRTRSHHSTLVRIAYSSFCRHLLSSCSQTLEDHTRSFLLDDLIALTCDDWPEVEAAAQTDFSILPSSSLDLAARLAQAIVALPQTILSHGDDEVRMSAAIRLLRGTSRAQQQQRSTASELAIDAERWSFSLLHALEFARIPIGSDHPTQGDAATARAWIGPPRAMMAIESNGIEEHEPSERPWPALAMRRIPSSKVVRELRGMVTELARASPDLVNHFLALATGGLEAKQRAAAWWLLDAALESLVPAKVGAKVSSRVRRTTRAIINAVVELQDAGPDDELEAPVASDAKSLIPVEHQRGSLELVTKLESYAPKGSSENKADAARSERRSTAIITAALSLRALATASAVLGTSFRSDLLSCLYPLLAHLSPSSQPLLQSHAEVALTRIAHHAAYASVENLVADNVDYVVNVVSQRLTFARLDLQAPLVLVTVIKLVGEPIVGLMQDVVDDVFDALDDYHGYDSLCASLLAVLDALVRAMSVDLPAPPEIDVNETGHQLPPEPEGDLATFEKWYKQRKEDLAAPKEDYGPVPEGGFASKALDEQEAEQQPEPEGPPPTRTQVACLAMLSKALLFLSHDSPFLRARVLSLLASGVPVLAVDRKMDVLPVIDRAWPYVLNRLSPIEAPYVIAEAAALIEVLGRYAGDFMSRRIVDAAWPRFHTLLERTDKRERGSALKGKTVFTVATRLYGSILGAMRDVAVSVPMDNELAWEVALAFRRFLREEGELLRRARELYEALRKWHPEVVWMTLAGAVNREGLPAFLRVEDMREEEVVMFL